MRNLVRAAWAVACLVGMLLAASTAGHCATIFYDSFEPPINLGLWTIGPASWTSDHHDSLAGQNNHIRTPGVWGARSWVVWRDAWNSQHQLGTSYDSNIYLKCWMFEDNDLNWPPGPETQYEGWPNGYITLLNSAWLANPTGEGADAFSIGVMGEVGRVSGWLRDYFENCCVYTAEESYVMPVDDEERPLVPRRQGWRKYTILVNGFTGNPGDVQFFVDDKLVYNGLRRAAVGGGGGAPLDTIVLGSRWWTMETYYFDQVEFGTIEPAISCDKISDALALPDGTWVTLDSKVVSGCFSYCDLPRGASPSYDKPFPGYLAIEEDDRSSALWVSTSYQAGVSAASNMAQRINVRGIMRTNEAGMRYLDAIEISSAPELVAQPPVVGTTLKNLGSPLLDGKLVKVWGKVINIPGSNPPTVRGQERTGDWRRYFLIDDGSPGGPVKCYYNNIIAAKPGVDPVPAVANGDYVSVVGVAGREVLVPGTTGPEKSVWIRGAGDLVILKR